MAWIKARFKEKDIWAEVDSAGKLIIADARVAIRYSASAGTKIYRGSAAGIELVMGVKPQELPDGIGDEPGAIKSTPASKTGAGSKATASRGFGSANTRTATQAAAAAADARSVIASLPPGTILAFTDGACFGNPGPAGSGVVVEIPGKTPVERYRALGSATNNVGELTAIRIALGVLDEEGVALDTMVSIFTDSEYSRGVLSLGWKAKANQELIEEIRSLLRKRSGVTLRWVAGHVGVRGNERADVLARKGAEESRTRR